MDILLYFLFSRIPYDKVQEEGLKQVKKYLQIPEIKELKELKFFLILFVGNQAESIDPVERWKIKELHFQDHAVKNKEFDFETKEDYNDYCYEVISSPDWYGVWEYEGYPQFVFGKKNHVVMLARGFQIKTLHTDFFKKYKKEIKQQGGMLYEPAND